MDASGTIIALWGRISTKVEKPCAFASNPLRVPIILSNGKEIII